MEIQEKRLDELKPYDNNPRINDEAVPFVAESLKEFGWQQPIVIDRDNVIIAGHTRYKAALKLGLKTAPCKYADELTPQQVDAYRLADNKTAELATWDDDKLTEELAKCADFDMSAFGFEEPPEDPDDVVEDEYEEFEVESVAKPGDIFQLGDHRLMCGDSTKPEDMARLFDGVKPLMVFTDPPYGVSIGSKNKTLNVVKETNYKQVKIDIKNDTLSPEQLKRLITEAFTQLKQFADEQCAYYIISRDRWVENRDSLCRRR